MEPAEPLVETLGSEECASFENNEPPKSSERRFRDLASVWKSETRFMSNSTRKAMHPAYQKIIGMGDQAVPFILQDFVANGPSDWFWVLTSITDVNPITPEIAGNMVAMTEAWLQWGKKKGYLKG